MLQEFKNFISKNKLFGKNDQILLTVSGGADSVAMLDLFHKSGYNIAIAHCNFDLRGEESLKDEIFVQELSRKYKIPCFINRCNAKSYTEKNKISIEMAARDLRYKWFDNLAKFYEFNKIATAHHQNDSVETILLNLSKRTGIRGLIGIPKINGNIIRPMLFALKDKILTYCKNNNLEYRTDKTNFETDFQRNKIRHLIIPEFEKINPAFADNVSKTAEYLSQYAKLFKIHFKKFKDLCTSYDNFSVYIDTTKIYDFKPVNLFMFEFLHQYGFNSSQVQDILNSINSTGKQFFSFKSRLLINRNELIISNLQQEKKQQYLINNIQEDIIINENKYDELRLKFNNYKIDDFALNKDKNIAYFDIDKLSFPLIIRKWKQGDVFYPFGMKGKKKLSKFFTDNKFSIIDKEKTWLLTSNNQIVWIIGHRADNRFRITSLTKNSLSIIKK